VAHSRGWRAGVLTVLLVALSGGVPVAHASGCQFVLGFATLHALIPQIVGQCVDNEGHNPVNGDGLQHTITPQGGPGLLVWRKSDNWTAFTDGFHTWVNGPHGLEERLNTQRFIWEANPTGLPVAPDAPVALPAPDLRTILFADAQHGWAAGSGRIVATTDGGRTWTTQFSGPTVIKQLDVLNANDGWALGDDVLLHTVDGGQSWVPVTEPPQPLTQIHFLNLADGYGVGGGTLYQTADAGVTWHALTTPIPVGGLCFVSQATGWVVNASVFLGNGAPSQPAAPALYATSNGGATWQPVALPSALTGFGSLGQRLQCAPPGVLWDLFLGGVGAGNEFYALYRLSANSTNWHLVTGHEISGGVGKEPGPYAGALSVVSGAAAFLTGVCGPCYPPSPTTPPAVALGGTADAGQTWHDFPVDALPPLTNDIAFVSANQGWLVAEGDAIAPSQILTTADGGRTWTKQFALAAGGNPRTGVR
jgi:hypothetical protein